MSEGEKHGLGVGVLLGGIFFVIIACCMHGGTAAAVVGMIGFVATIAGFFLTFTNRSNSMIEQQRKLTQAQVNLLAQKVRAGQSTSSLVDEMSGYSKMKQKEETKKIVKGAVVGGIVAGDVGAVVGAVAAKNKIENEKKNK